MSISKTPPRRARAAFLALALATGLAGCTYYPGAYGYNGYYSGYYGGYYAASAPAVVVAPAPVVVGGGWWGGGWGWGGGWHGGCCWR